MKRGLNMRHIPGSITFWAIVLFCATGAMAAEWPAFHDAAAPEGWTVEKRGVLTYVTTAAPIEMPVQATFRVRVPEGGHVQIAAMEKPKARMVIFKNYFRALRAGSIGITAHSDNTPMWTNTNSNTSWPSRGKPSGSVGYAWRFPEVRNLWDERDRAEIGAAYAELVPLNEKILTLRWVLTDGLRQMWLDDRLMAEERAETPKQAYIELMLRGGGEVLSADFSEPVKSGGFVPLSLLKYSHRRDAQALEGGAKPGAVSAGANRSIPTFGLVQSTVDVDLGESLYRYRLSHGSGPNAPYVNARSAWPNPFSIDPARMTFRVPFRAYQNVWLTAWLDDDVNKVPRGVFRFYREMAGYCATTEFEITDEAIRKGLVSKLDAKTTEGKALYLIRVPVDSDGLYGFNDMATQFLDFELTKPLALYRSYPDPIYYGMHPAGPDSAIHVTGITLEEAPFSYEVKPAQTAHVFELPQKVNYLVSVSNNTTGALKARVVLSTKSYDGLETHDFSADTTVAAAKSGDVSLALDLKELGWHELRARVEAGGVVRENTLSLVVLPPNRRTYGTASNETRFGLWSLWGHYLPVRNAAYEDNARYLPLFRKMGMRYIGVHSSFLKEEDAKRYDFLPKSPHTIVAVFHRLNEKDPKAMDDMVAKELAQVKPNVEAFGNSGYFYGGEWHLGREIQYAPWPAYTGEGDRGLNEDELKRVTRQTTIFTAIGRAMREKYPQVKLFLQWGAPQGTIAFLKNGFPKELVDGFGMDAPMFELLPEISNVTGCINGLWWLRKEAEKAGWPRLPIAWAEGPFFPTNKGAMTERDQEQRHIRYWLLAMAYGIDRFEAGVVDFDAGNYYGAEHYGAGVFHRTPLENPKPAVAAIATATTMLCGADPVGRVDTGSLTTYCMSFKKDDSMLYALWRVRGTAEAALAVKGKQITVTDAMGNARSVPVADGVARISLSPSPVWVTGAGTIESVRCDEPTYVAAPAVVTRPLTDMTAANWAYDGSEDKAYAENHFAIKRITDPNLAVKFNVGEKDHADALAVSLPKEPGTRPLANRYGTLKALKPIRIPGRPSALGLWVKGNNSWGRVVFQVRDAKGELWTSNGTKEDWNCDDTHAWSYVNFEGWRYISFPLPGNHPWDGGRELETTWWGSRDGDGYVDLPLTLEKIYVEARNMVPSLGEMSFVTQREYKLSKLVAEYVSEDDASDDVLKAYASAKPIPDWSGPTRNPIAELAEKGEGEAPVIKGFEEPHHWNDGRRMIIRFDEQEGMTYNLYLSRYEDGRGAELVRIRGGVKDKLLVRGFRPDTEMYLFLTSVGKDKKESKPSKAFKLITKDNFAEK